MKANELRIGNYVTFLGQYVQIKGISNDSIKKELGYITTTNGVNTTTSFKPIKLTEEILLKCSGTLMSDEVHFKGMCMQYFKGKLYYSAGEGIPLSKEIQYVHQLQNLYFVLTEKELKINL